MTTAAVQARMTYWPTDGPSMLTHPPVTADLRKPRSGRTVLEARPTPVYDAREALAQGSDLGLETSGFELRSHPSAVRDWYDTDQVMSVYYEECKALARSITGATHAFTFDHLIREPGLQITGGGIDGSAQTSGVDAGGGYISAAHMDYMPDFNFEEYLALHGVSEPANPSRVVVLNFWRPICSVIEDNPLGVCDARTVRPEDLHGTIIFGYGSKNYSFHDIGIESFSVKASDEQRWYYFPRMTPDELLLIKSYDSRGVIGSSSPHASFPLPDAPREAAPRRSIELRVLCYVTDS